MKNGENIMKKFVALLLALVMALSLVACGDKTDDSSNNDNNSNTDTPQVDSSEYALKTQITSTDKITIRVAEDASEIHPSHIALVNCFKEPLEAASNGNITVEIQAITGATAETYATLGVGMDMKVNEANGEMTINKDGYYENMTIFMDVVMNITDMETSEVDVMNYKIDMNMDCKNPGKEVLFELPSTDGFEELNLLDLTGEEQE